MLRTSKGAPEDGSFRNRNARVEITSAVAIEIGWVYKSGWKEPVITMKFNLDVFLFSAELSQRTP